MCQLPLLLSARTTRSFLGTSLLLPKRGRHTGRRPTWKEGGGGRGNGEEKETRFEDESRVKSEEQRGDANDTDRSAVHSALAHPVYAADDVVHPWLSLVVHQLPFPLLSPISCVDASLVPSGSSPPPPSLHSASAFSPLSLREKAGAPPAWTLRIVMGRRGWELRGSLQEGCGRERLEGMDGFDLCGSHSSVVRP